MVRVMEMLIPQVIHPRGIAPRLSTILKVGLNISRKFMEIPILKSLNIMTLDTFSNRNYHIPHNHIRLNLTLIKAKLKKK